MSRLTSPLAVPGVPILNRVAVVHATKGRATASKSLAVPSRYGPAPFLPMLLQSALRGSHLL